MSKSDRLSYFVNSFEKWDSWQRLAIIYFALPFILFAFSHFNFLVFVVTTAPVLILLYAVFYRWSFNLSLKEILFFSGLAIATCVFTGVGEFLCQHGDYAKHNLLLSDLYHSPWPVKYSEEILGKPSHMMTYYLGYYLIPSGIAKGIGLSSLKYVMLLWNSIGLTLVFGYSYTFFKKRKQFILFWLMFIVWGGIDIIPWLIQTIADNSDSTNSLMLQVKDLTKPFINKRTVVGFTATMQHTIPMLFIIFYFLKREFDDSNWILILGAFSLFWSPFAVLVLLTAGVFKFRYFLTELKPITFLLIPSVIVIIIYYFGAPSLNSGSFFYHWDTTYWIKIIMIRAYNFVLTFGWIYILIWLKRKSLSRWDKLLLVVFSFLTFATYFLRFGNVFIPMQMGSEFSVNFSFVLSVILLVLFVKCYFQKLKFSILLILLFIFQAWSALHNTEYSGDMINNIDMRFRKNPNHFPRIEDAITFGNISSLDSIMWERFEAKPNAKSWHNRIPNQKQLDGRPSFYQQYISPITPLKEKLMQ
jgi:hypothetical protein